MNSIDNSADNPLPRGLSTPRQRELIVQLQELIQYRRARQQEIEERFDTDSDACRQSTAAEIQRRSAEFQAQYDRVHEKYIGRLELARRSFEDTQSRIQQDRQRRLDDIERQYRSGCDALEVDLRQSQALAERDHQQDLRVADGVAQQAKETVDNDAAQFDWLKQQALAMLRRRRVTIALPDHRQLHPDATTATLIKRYREEARRTGELYATVNRDPAVRFVDEGWAILVFIAAIVFIGAILGWRAGFTGWSWAAISLGAAFAVSLGLRQACQIAARRRTIDLCQQLHESVGHTTIALNHASDMIQVEHRARDAEIEKRRDKVLQEAREKYDLESSRLDSQRRSERQRVETELAALEATHHRTWDSEAKVCRETFPPMMEKLQAEHDAAVARMNYERDTRLAELANEHAVAWEALVTRWRTGVRNFAAEVAAMQDYCTTQFPQLETMDWDRFAARTDVPLAVPFGGYPLELSMFEGGMPDDPHLAVSAHRFQFPAVLAFPSDPSLLVEAEGHGRDAAVSLFQLVMLRMLTSLPAGKVRFTIIDPTGLGQNFSAFMHLADFDERLVTNRIWTETNHINQRLSDLTEHMENVIQKYLRNEFTSIQEYNEHAGEVAEPFQVLVVANFPANFSDEATRRLVSIATSGAKCGVYTFISVDTKMKPPRNFDLADLEAHANTLVWDAAEQRLAWKDEVLQRFELSIDRRPQDELVTRIIRAAGQLATEANRVEVPFETVAPRVEHWWTSDSRHQIEVALGRAGATKLQFMSLGKGTSQHVLIAGKTGSGKSTLMHAMITSLALHYSPEELQFFLVDFKKGVEFKSYAEHRLPHARVVAIESEREFGLSVLQRLDQELQQRGELFRASGVQTIAAFRDANPDVLMPRLLLMVDEFQEFFVNDDKIASESSLLLDRLVRQGRAFGIHVVLGSQTLAGAYSLARSTLGQMAVRIALQCSEADSHLILSEENTAARLLNRPGEAIYNNANGLFEGNHPFQVVWLPDHQREDYLKRLSALAETRKMAPARPIVFEGNEAADLAQNPWLARALQHSPTAPPILDNRNTAWLGAAVAIKDPTSIVFRAQAGNNLLVVGANEELADGVLSAAIVSLLVSSPRGESERARFVVFDGGRYDSSGMNLSARFARCCRDADHMTMVDAAQVDAKMRDVHGEVTRRGELGQVTHPPLYLVIYNLARFRQLRRDENDFGMSSFDGEDVEKVSQLFGRIVSEGSAVNVHVLMWCDSYNNLTRWLERSTLREFAYRVALQMSPGDSSNLIDSAAAGQLGQYRAMFYDDERGEYEKFQPYGPPSAELLSRLAQPIIDQHAGH